MTWGSRVAQQRREATASSPLQAAVVGPEEQVGDGVAFVSTKHPDAPEDPAGTGVFAPDVCILILERDGVTVRGVVDAATGDGIPVLLDRLKADLLLKRAGEPVPEEPPLGELVGAGRAEAAGHDPDPVTGRCVHCGIARWAQLAGHPCEPRADLAQPDLEGNPAEEPETTDGEAYSSGTQANPGQ